MQKFIRQVWCVLMLAAFVGGTALSAFAADVRVAISTQDTYVGMPIILQIQVSDASQIDPPVIPDVEDVAIKSRGTPSRSTQIVTINGTTTTTTSQTYVYEITPQRAGSFHIPPINVQADGSQQQTQAIDFVASKSETGDLMFVEVAGKEKQIYVGQALDLTLKIWLRPFRDNQRNITLSAADMWQLISERSAWGVFADQIKQMTDDGRRPSAREVLRKDRAGVEHSYYLYEINATVYPKRPGKIDANDVHVIANYPIALGRSRSPFSGVFDDMRLPGGFNDLFGDDDFPSPFGPRLTVRSVRPIVAEASVEPIHVLPIPTADRPADYRGAVGHYQIVTEAEPTTVKAGDPINLLIGIAGTGPMELVQAPPLAELSELTNDFKVPNEPLAGFVQDDRKIFSTTIRPRREGISQIPAIPFSFFDPQQNKFVTVHSKPISIHVDPADNLALDAIVSSHTNAGSGRDRENKAEENAAALSFENYSGNDLLMNESPFYLDATWIAFSTVLPPLIVLAIFVTRNRRWISQFAGRFGSGIRRAQIQIDNVKTVAEVCRILQMCLQREFALSAHSADTASVIGTLRTSGFRKLAVRCERVFSLNYESESGQIGGRLPLAEAKREALEALADLQRKGQRRQGRPSTSIRKPRSIKPTAAKISRKTSKFTASAIVVGSMILVEGTAFAAETTSQSMSHGTPVGSHSFGTQYDAGTTGINLAKEQEVTILAEANDSYTHALQTAGDDSADAKQAFADAAERYQLLVDSGVTNSRLYVNLANAYLQSGQKGMAIANYQKSLRLDPTNRAARNNLTFAVQAANVQPGSPEASQTSENSLIYASAANSWLSRYLSPRATIAITIVAWFALWLAIGLRLVGIRFPWKSAAAISIVLGVIAAGSYAITRIELRNNTAVVTSPTVTLREGDGRNFPKVNGAQLHEGQTVEVLRRRGNWIEVRSRSGRTGWLFAPSVEVVGSA